MLVIADQQLVTAGVELADDAAVEIRPVISGGAGAPPRCVVCREPAVHEEPRHRSAWCVTHLTDHVEQQALDTKRTKRLPRTAGEANVQAAFRQRFLAKLANNG